MTKFQLKPTPPQDALLRQSLTLLNEARTAVCNHQRVRLDNDLQLLKITDIVGENPAFAIDEAVRIARGVTNTGVVRRYLRAGLNDAKNRVVDESALYRVDFIPIHRRLRRVNNKVYFSLDNIGDIEVVGTTPHHSEVKCAYIDTPHAERGWQLELVMHERDDIELDVDDIFAEDNGDTRLYEAITANEALLEDNYLDAFTAEVCTVFLNRLKALADE